MINSFRSLIISACALVLATGTTLQAQDIKIALVDMQAALDRYYKTEVEVGEINALADEKRKSLDQMKVGMQELQDKMVELGKTVQDTSLSESVRKEAAEQGGKVRKELDVKAREYGEAQRAASNEYMTARSEMEGKLVAEIKETVNAMVRSKGLDLVFDKSFLPRANKAILFASDNVIDLTDEVVETMNAGKPASATTAKE